MPPSKREDRGKRLDMRGVAEQAGVAVSSVSRVLSGHPDVSDAMRERVMAVVAELDYQPDMLAQGLRRQTTMSIGFAASNIVNPMLGEAVMGAEAILRDAGYGMLLTDADGDAELDAANLSLLEHRRVDGILLAHGDERHPAVVRAIRAAKVPLVLIDRDPPRGVELPGVRFDHRAGMKQAAAHLRELGHTDIGMVVGGPRRPSRERKAGVLDVFGRRGDGHCEVLEGDFSIDFGYAGDAAVRRAGGAADRADRRRQHPDARRPARGPRDRRGDRPRPLLRRLRRRRGRASSTILRSPSCGGRRARAGRAPRR